MTPLSLLLIIAVGDGSNIDTAALVDTVRGELDASQVTVVARAAPVVLPAAMARVTAAAARRGPVAQVTWVSDERAVVRVSLRPGQWHERSLTFRAADPMNERGRTVAFAVAAMFPAWRPAAPQAGRAQRHRAVAHPVDRRSRCVRTRARRGADRGSQRKARRRASWCPLGQPPRPRRPLRRRREAPRLQQGRRRIRCHAEGRRMRRRPMW